MFAVNCNGRPDSPRSRKAALTVEEARSDGTTSIGEIQEVTRIKDLQRGRSQNRRRSTLSLQDTADLQPPKQFLSRDGVHYISPYPSPSLVRATTADATMTSNMGKTFASGQEGYFDQRIATDILAYATYTVVSSQGDSDQAGSNAGISSRKSGLDDKAAGILQA